MSFLTSLESVVMNNEDMKSIFDQINNLKKPVTESKETNAAYDFTQEDLCRITNMSQSNISKIQNGKVVPRIETLQKIANATHTRLVISFESMEGED